MMSELIDISVQIRPGMPIWPGSVGVRVTRTRSLEQGDALTETRLDMDVHCGTHVEGPMHLIAGGSPIQSAPLEMLVGPAWVANIAGSEEVSRQVLEMADIPDEATRVLLKTSNSAWWSEPSATFRPDYVGLTLDAAQWVADRELLLIGIDYLSIQRFEDTAETHRVLMGAGVVILEGLNLTEVDAGWYRLTCLPLSMDRTEAAPARAMLERLP